MFNGKIDSFKLKLIVAFIGIYVVWGSTYLAIKFAIDTIPPFMMGAVRFLIAGFLLYAMMRLQGSQAPTRRQWLEAGMLGVALIGIGNGGVMLASQSIPTGILSLLVATVPLYVVVIEKRPGKWQDKRLISGLLLGILGIASLLGPSAFVGGDRMDWWGVVAVMASAFAWSAGSVYSRTMEEPKCMMLYTAMQMIVGGAALAVVSVFMGEHHAMRLSELTPISIASVAYLIVFGSFFGYTAYVWLLKHVEVSKVSTYAYVNPIVAVLLGWGFAGEAVTAQTLFAGCIILAAVFLMTGGKKKSIEAST